MKYKFTERSASYPKKNAWERKNAWRMAAVREW
jgi:hypothetical protein